MMGNEEILLDIRYTAVAGCEKLAWVRQVMPRTAKMLAVELTGPAALDSGVSRYFVLRATIDQQRHAPTPFQRLRGRILSSHSAKCPAWRVESEEENLFFFMKRANFDSFEQIDTNNEIKFGKKKSK